MVQLRILSGKKAGAVWVARRFPVRIGRAAAADVQLEENGVWDEHLLIGLEPGAGFRLRAQSGGLASVNGQAVEEVLLRNGDVIQIGSAKLQFWLAATRQWALPWREGLTWAMIVGVGLAQIGLLYWLLR